MQPGGHLEPRDLTVAAAALREAVEETGVAGCSWRGPTRAAGPARRALRRRHHLDVQFLVLAADDADVAVSEESLDVALVAVDALPAHLAEMVRLSLAGARTTGYQTVQRPHHLGVAVGGDRAAHRAVAATHRRVSRRGSKKSSRTRSPRPPAAAARARPAGYGDRRAGQAAADQAQQEAAPRHVDQRHASCPVGFALSPRPPTGRARPPARAADQSLPPAGRVTSAATPVATARGVSRTGGGVAVCARRSDRRRPRAPDRRRPPRPSSTGTVRPPAPAQATRPRRGRGSTR